MTMVEFSESVNQTYDDYMMFMTRWTSLMEAVDGELQENLDQARLKVLNENGNYEDLIYLEEAAEDSAFQKFKAAMKKLWDKVISTIKSMQTKIVDFFTIEKEKKMKDIANSELGKQKIECPDYQEIEKAEKEYKHVIQKWIARFKSGQNPDVEELEDAKKKYQSRRDAALKTTKVFSIAAVIGVLFGISSKAKKSLDKDWNEYKNNNSDYDKQFQSIMGEKDPSQCKSKMEYLRKMEVYKYHEAIEEQMNKFNFIKIVQKKLHGVGKKAVAVDINKKDFKKGKVAKESGGDIMTTLEEETLLDELIESVEEDIQHKRDLYTEKVSTYFEDVEDYVLGQVSPRNYLESVEEILGIVSPELDDDEIDEAVSDLEDSLL